MNARKPIVAGQFYPMSPQQCIDEITEYMAEKPLTGFVPDRIVAGIVPHAGWVFSGALALMVLSAVKSRHEHVDTFVIFGAAHSYYGPKPAVYDMGSWKTPLGEVEIDEKLARAVIETGTAIASPGEHAYEHSIEVQVPMIKHLFDGAKILPIIVTPARTSIDLGQAVGKIISGLPDQKIVCLGSTDLTHYGPRYGYEPMGVGPEACKWASEENDKLFIDAALALDFEAMLTTARQNSNACGPGAAAATAAAARELGITKGHLLAQTNSNEIMINKMGTSSSESVGYAAIVF